MGVLKSSFIGIYTLHSGETECFTIGGGGLTIPILQTKAINSVRVRGFCGVCIEPNVMAGGKVGVFDLTKLVEVGDLVIEASWTPPCEWAERRTSIKVRYGPQDEHRCTALNAGWWWYCGWIQGWMEYLFIRGTVTEFTKGHSLPLAC